MDDQPRLGWVIVYVPDVLDALAFYERAFGLRRGFVDAQARRRSRSRTARRPVSYATRTET